MSTIVTTHPTPDGDRRKTLGAARLFTLLALLACCQGGACQGSAAPASQVEPQHTAAAASASAAPSSAPAAMTPFVSAERFDTLIAGGTLLDGSGAAGRAGDVLIRDGRIIHVGAVDSSVKVDARIDATGMVVTPGFIDTHSHGDAHGANQNALAMGVTTLCIGQDGRSPSRGRIEQWAKRMESKKLTLNVAPLVGHGTVRGLARVGMTPTDEQLKRMVQIVEQELAAGAWGLSTGLEYQPGSFAKRAELIAIAKPVAAVDGVVMSHLRSEDDDEIDAALDELIAQGQRGGARVHVAHIKVVHGKGAGRAGELLARMQAARERGVKLTADVYPYNASYTTISIVFPDFAKPPHSFAEVKKNRRDDLAAYLRKRITKRGGPSATLFGTRPFRGKTLAQLAKEKNKPFEDVLIDDVGLNGASAAYFVMDDALQARLIGDPHVMFGSDGSSGSSHPRGYGTFAKLIAEHVVTRKTISLPEAVRKLSGLAAKTVGLTRIKRGLLLPGWAADVLVFDPAAIRHRADYQHPHRLSQGMSWVLVNGLAVVDQGRFHLERRAGKLLRRK